MRAPAGAIAAVPAGQRFARSVLAEAAAAAAACGHPVPTGPLHVTEQALTAPGSSATSSLTRDLIAGRRTGVEAVLADLAARARAAGTATPLISQVIEMAADNLALPEGAIFHSDRGSNYTSAAFAMKLSELGIRQSVGRTGICYDNALSESVNGTLKVELVHRTAYATRRQACNDIARWIELRYNRTRLHSTLVTGLRRKSCTS